MGGVLSFRQGTLAPTLSHLASCSRDDRSVDASLPFDRSRMSSQANRDTCALFCGYQPRLCSRGQQSIRSAERGISYRQRVSSCVQTLQTSGFAIQGSGNSIQSSRHPIRNATVLADNAVVEHVHSFPGWKTASADRCSGLAQSLGSVGCRHRMHSDVWSLLRVSFLV